MTVSTPDKPHLQTEQSLPQKAGPPPKLPSGTTHEVPLAFEAQKPPSERSFGLLFAGIFTLVGLIPLLSHQSIPTIPLGIGLGFGLMAWLSPALLQPLNILWFKFGLLLHKIISPIVLGILFYGLLTPFAVLSRMTGKSFLQLAIDKQAPSYWVEKPASQTSRQAMKRQY